MKYTAFFFSLLMSYTLNIYGQETQTVEQIIKQYDIYRERSIQTRRFKHADIVPLIEGLKSDKRFEVSEAGKSIEGRSIYHIKIGTGETKVLLWSQMHGDESTATMALLDLFNFLKAEDEFSSWKQGLLGKVSLHFIPMLNPDGAEKFTRRNRLGVDLNRDALRLQSPEARVLKGVRDELDADFGFNLHDQGRVYTAGVSNKPATISVLAPAYNYSKDINEVRGNAMKVIALMNRTLQQHIPGQIGKYNDDFEPRAFGDNIQKWGTSAILIESGGERNDREKQSIRKINFIALLTSIHAIATGIYENEKLEDYESIPFNERLLYDLMIRQVEIDLLGNPYTVDIAINKYEADAPDHRSFRFISRVAEWGDLSIFHGYKEIGEEGLKAETGKLYPQMIKNAKAFQALDHEELFKQGYTHIRLKKSIQEAKDSPFILLSKKENFRTNLNLGSEANIVLKKEGIVKYVVINGDVVWKK